MRRRLLEGRARRTVAERVDAAARLAVSVLPAAGTVAAYASVGGEPGTRPLLDRLRASSVRVLLPVVAGTALDWAVYDGSLVPAAHGLLEPGGRRLGPAALAEASIVLVPALAVDRHGGRLGRGGGFYDRTLGSVAPGALTLAVVYEDELVAEVPMEPHDIRVGGALLPGGLQRF